MSHDTELKIARHLIRNILKEGYELRVHDGEEFATPRTANFDCLNKALASTDYDSLIVYKNGAPKRAGSILLVWGNGADVLSDHTDNALMERLTRPTMTYAEKFDA